MSSTKAHAVNPSDSTCTTSKSIGTRTVTCRYNILLFLGTLFTATLVFFALIVAYVFCGNLPPVWIKWIIPFWTNCPPLLQNAIGVLPWILVVFAHLIMFNNQSISWNNNDSDYHYYLRAEIIMKSIRFVIYFLAIIELHLVYFLPSFRTSTVCLIHTTFMAIPLSVSLYQTMWRLNFRRWANYVLSVSDALIYLALLDLFCSYSDPGAPILGLIDISRDTITNRIGLIHPVIQGTIILAPFIAVVKEALSNIFNGISSLNASDLPQYRRRTRSRLLTHRYYHYIPGFFTLENTLLPLLISQIVIFIAAIVCVLAHPNIKYVPDEYGTLIAQETLSINGYLVFIAMASAATAFVSFWSISDDHLIRNEYLYLTYQGPHIKPHDIKNSTARWTDYCQVLVNLYSSGSGLESENQRYHDLQCILCGIRNRIYNMDFCAGLRFAADLLGAKGDRNAALRREAAHNTDEKKLPAKSDIVKMAQDLQFARDMLSLTKRDILPQTEKPISILSCNNTFTFIRYLTETFFGKDIRDWNQWFHTRNIDIQEGIDLLKMDSILHILQRERNNDCCLNWLGCSCKDMNQSRTYLENRLALLLTYPYIVVDCYIVRWGKPANIASFLPHFMNYYEALFEDELYIEDPSILPGVIEHVLNSLVTAGSNLAWLSLVGQSMSAQKINPNITDRKNNRICSVNSIRIKALEDNKTKFKQLEGFYGETLSKTTTNDLFRIAYSIFHKPLGPS